jgi:hypothetical protein
MILMHRKPMEIQQALRTDPRIVVLGDPVLQGRKPRVVRRLLGSRRRVVILHPVRTDPGQILPWAREGFDRVTGPGGLTEAILQALAELNAGLVRPTLDPPDWCKVTPPPGVPGGPGAPGRSPPEAPPLGPGMGGGAALVLHHSLPRVSAGPRAVSPGGAVPICECRGPLGPCPGSHRRRPRLPPRLLGPLQSGPLVREPRSRDAAARSDHERNEQARVKDPSMDSLRREDYLLLECPNTLCGEKGREP